MPKWNILSPTSLITIIIVLIGILYGTFYHYGKIAPELNAALTVTLLLFLAEKFVEIKVKFDKASTGGQQAAEIETYLTKNRDIFGELLQDIHKEMANTITFRQDGFKLSGPFVPILSYATFWDLVTREQSRRGKSRSLNVLAIHSCEPGIWIDHWLAARLIERQREFIELGGTVTRILCAQGEPDEELRNASAKMTAAGIEVKYYDIDAGIVDHSFSWDFLYIRETEQSVVWDSFLKVPGGVIQEAVYLHSLYYNQKDLAKLWKDIDQHSRKFSAGALGTGAGTR